VTRPAGRAIDGLASAWVVPFPWRGIGCRSIAAQEQKVTSVRDQAGGELFVSYKSQDRARAATLVRALEASGRTVWWDQQIGVGSAWRQAIADRLDAAAAVIVLWSARSIGAEGQFVHDEASRAMRRGTYVPVLIDPVEPPLGFGGVQCHSLVGWTGNVSAPKFQELIGHLDRLCAAASGLDALPATGPAPGPLVRRRALLLGLGGAAVATAGGLALVGGRHLRCRVGLCPVPETVGVAVLPFRNLSASRDSDYLAEGVTEELRTALMRAGGVRIAGRTSSNRMSSTDDPRAIADQLGVEFLLDGSIRAVEGNVRVNASLVEAESGFTRWSEAYDRPRSDVLAMQSGIATAVAEALRGRLGTAERASVARAPTGSSIAFEAYLRGRKLLDLASDVDTDRAALALFDTAVAADPAFAAAHAGRARSLQAIAGGVTDVAELEASQVAALAAARRAVALDPALSEAQSTLGYILMYGRFDFAGARKAFEQARKAAPHDADVLIRYGLFHARVGEMKTGLDALRRAVDIDPLNPRAHRALGLALYADRQFPAAIAAMREGLRLNPGLSVGHATIGDCLLQQGEWAKAQAEYGLEPERHLMETGLAILLRRTGDVAGSERAFAALRSRGDAVSYQVAQVHAQWGRPEAAVAALDRAYRVRDAGLPLVRNDPAFDPMRTDPQFRAFLRRLGLGG
jgi:TolB-like protein/tetratricopeptide (TPR) repeat protein